MKRMTAVMWVVAMVAPAMAQEDPVERQVQRLREGLQLSEEQATKVREIVKKQNEDVRGVLTEEQKGRYEELQNRMGGGRGGQGGGQGGRGFGGGFRQMMAMPSTDELKEQLKLTDEQVSKINEIRDEVRQEMRDFFMERPSQEEMQKKMQEIRETTVKRAREALTDEQKTKFGEIVKTFQQQGGGDAPRASSGPGERRQRSSVDERVRRVMEAMHMDSAEDAAAVRDCVKKVIETQYAAEDFDRDTRSKLDELARKTDAAEDEIKAKIEEIRTGRKDKEKATRDAQKALFEIVTYKQELELIRQGILR